MYGLISEDYLMHHGVKGMKWGIRHDPQRTGRTTGSAKSSRSRNGLSSKQKKVLKGAAIAAGVVGVAALGTVAIRNVKITKAAKKTIISTIEKEGHQTVREALGSYKESVIRNRESAKFTNDQSLKDSKRAVANYYERHYSKVEANKDKIVADRVKSIPKKEINKEARSLAKQWKDISKQNNKIYRHNEKVRKKEKKGKATWRDYKQYKQRPNYRTPTDWYKYYNKDWM